MLSHALTFCLPLLGAAAVGLLCGWIAARAKPAVHGQLGPYTLGEKLGEGGMGSVYLARHATLRRLAAVKVLSPERSSSADIARFEREVELTSMLTHPNTIAIYDGGRTADGVLYYAMEYIDGLSLEELVRNEGPQAPERVIHVLRQIAGALGEAHRGGLVHRDVKPANILLCERGGVSDWVKLVDFGLVKQASENGDGSVTQTNAVTGTPAYIAPETISTPAAVDGRTDIYGLGCVAYFMLTGSPVFTGSNVVELCAHHMYSPPEPPSKRLGAPIPAQLERFVLACLAKRPEDRPCDVERELESLARIHAWSNDAAASCWTNRRSTREPLLEAA